MLQIIESSGETCERRHAELLTLIGRCQEGLAPSLAQADAAQDYVAKICAKALLVEYREGEALIGAVSFYANDFDSCRGFITLVAVDPAWRGHGIARKMMDATIAYLVDKGFRSVSLKVLQGNTPAIRLYGACSFTPIAEDEHGIEMAAQL